MPGSFQYPAIVEPVLPQPPAPNTLDKWFVERLPYSVPPTSSYPAIIGMLMADTHEILPLPPAASFLSVILSEDLGWRILEYFKPALSAAATEAYSNALFKALVQEHVLVDKWQSYERYPFSIVPNIAVSQTSGSLGPIFPQPFIPATVTFAGLFQDTPNLSSYYTKNWTAWANVTGTTHKLRPILLVSSQFGWKLQDARPSFNPQDSVAQIANLVGSAAPILPQAIAAAIVFPGSYLQEWFPQWQKPTSTPALNNIQAYFAPVLPQPFVPAIIIGLPWWQQEVQQFQAINRFDWERLYTGSVQNIKPIPFVPPPPPPPVFCPLPPTGPDSDVSMSVFGGTAQPLQVLFCRICNSGKPLVIRADYAIWCQDCCAFVSKQDTYMGTVRAPGQLKGVF